MERISPLRDGSDDDDPPVAAVPPLDHDEERYDTGNYDSIFDEPLNANKGDVGFSSLPLRDAIHALCRSFRFFLAPPMAAVEDVRSNPLLRGVVTSDGTLLRARLKCVMRHALVQALSLPNDDDFSVAVTPEWELTLSMVLDSTASAIEEKRYNHLLVALLSLSLVRFPGACSSSHRRALAKAARESGVLERIFRTMGMPDSVLLLCLVAMFELFYEDLLVDPSIGPGKPVGPTFEKYFANMGAVVSVMQLPVAVPHAVAERYMRRMGFLVLRHPVWPRPSITPETATEDTMTMAMPTPVALAMRAMMALDALGPNALPGAHKAAAGFINLLAATMDGWLTSNSNPSFREGMLFLQFFGEFVARFKPCRIPHKVGDPPLVDCPCVVRRACVDFAARRSTVDDFNVCLNYMHPGALKYTLARGGLVPILDWAVECVGAYGTPAAAQWDERSFNSACTALILASRENFLFTAEGYYPACLPCQQSSSPCPHDGPREFCRAFCKKMFAVGAFDGLLRRVLAVGETPPILEAAQCGVPIQALARSEGYLDAVLLEARGLSSRRDLVPATHFVQRGIVFATRLFKHAWIVRTATMPDSAFTPRALDAVRAVSVLLRVVCACIIRSTQNSSTEAVYTLVVLQALHSASGIVGELRQSEECLRTHKLGTFRADDLLNTLLCSSAALKMIGQGDSLWQDLVVFCSNRLSFVRPENGPSPPFPSLDANCLLLAAVCKDHMGSTVALDRRIISGCPCGWYEVSVDAPLSRQAMARVGGTAGGPNSVLESLQRTESAAAAAAKSKQGAPAAAKQGGAAKQDAGPSTTPVANANKARAEKSKVAAAPSASASERSGAKDVAGPSTGTSQVKVCAACGTSSVKLFRCSRCLAVRYCSRECQKTGWSSHKETCKPPAAAGESPVTD